MEEFQKKKLLIVDDEPEIRMLVRDVIDNRLDGVAFFEAGDGADALAKLENEPIGVMITDLKMPKVSGYSLIENINDLPPSHRPRFVLVLSAYLTSERPVSAGPFISYMAKPFQADNLIEFCDQAFREISNQQKPEDFSIINSTDFNPIRLEVTAKNATTDIDFDPSQNITVEQFLDDGLVLEVPKGGCASGHSLILQISTSNSPIPVEFNTTAKVVESELVGDTRQRITVHLVQYDKQSWEMLGSVYNNRQAEIERLMRSMKGF